MARRVVAVVLAAGQSTRFGGDKLLHKLGDRPLGAHIAATLMDLPLAARLAVIPQDSPRRALYSGFEIIENPHPSRGMGTSLALGATRAIALDADALLVCLADMPYVGTLHLAALLATEGPVVATVASGIRSPPALFSREILPLLATLTGDAGARDLIRSATTITADAAMLRDFDTPADFA